MGKTAIIEFKNSFHNMTPKCMRVWVIDGVYTATERQIKRLNCGVKGCCCGWTPWLNGEELRQVSDTEFMTYRGYNERYLLPAEEAIRAEGEKDYQAYLSRLDRNDTIRYVTKNQEG